MNNQFQCFDIFDLNQCNKFSSTDKFRIDYHLNAIEEQISPNLKKSSDNYVYT